MMDVAMQTKSCPNDDGPRTDAFPMKTQHHRQPQQHGEHWVCSPFWETLNPQRVLMPECDGVKRQPQRLHDGVDVDEVGFRV